MKKIVLTIFLAAGGIWSSGLFAGDPAGSVIEDKEEGTFSKITVNNWEDKTQKPKIHDSKINVIVEDITPDSKNPSQELNGLAGKIAVVNKRIEWSPLWRNKGPGGTAIPGVWLPSYAMSGDKSVFALVETTGDDNGPYGSRIVFLNTANWKVLRIIDVDRLISKIAFLPGSDMLVCWAERQLPLKQPYTLFILDCRNGKIASASAAVKQGISEMLCDSTGRRIYLKSAEQPEIYVFNSENLGGEPLKIKTFAPGGTIAIGRSEPLLASAVGNKVEILSSSDFKLKNSQTLPEGFEAYEMQFCGPDSLVILSKDGKTFYIKDKIQKKVTDYGGKVISYNVDLSQLFIGRENKNDFVVMKIPEMEEIESLSPFNTRPVSFAKPIMAEFLAKGQKGQSNILILDEHGSLYIMTRSSKIWKKQIFISVKR